MMLPVFLNPPTISKYSLQLSFTLSKDLFWFAGHFPEQAIFPGVAQIDWVMHYAQTYFNITAFGGIDVVKFQSPLCPEDDVVLTIDWLFEKNKLKFEYAKSNKIASTGQINL